MSQRDGSCLALLGTGSRKVARSCLAAMWTQQCATNFWKEIWRKNVDKLSKLAHAEFVEFIRERTHERCWDYQFRHACQATSDWMEQISSFYYSGFAGHGTGFIHPQELIDIAEVTAIHCPVYYHALRLLVQELPEILGNETLVYVRRSRLHLGLPSAILWQVVQRKEGQVQVENSAWAVWRAVAEAPFVRELASRGIQGIDTCSRIGFRQPVCTTRFAWWSAVDMSGQLNYSTTQGWNPMLSAIRAIGLSSSLLATFYRQRDPGLDPAVINRLLCSEKGSIDYISGLFAWADRQRNLGQSHSVKFAEAFDSLQNLVKVGPSKFQEALFPVIGPPNHLIFHFLEKLSLALVVNISIQIPTIETLRFRLQGSFGDVFKWYPGPAVPFVQMSVLPGRDIISDKVRSTKEFHCPTSFMHLLGIVVDKSPRISPLRVVEVGGFLGDCVLWAMGVLGPSRMRAMEIEPVQAAMRRFKQTLNRMGFADSVEILEEPLGDGGPQLMRRAVGPQGSSPANPNFHLVRGGTGDRSSATQFRPKTVDEALEAWSGMPKGASIDLLRVKAAASEGRILKGAYKSLSCGRVRHLLVFTDENSAEIDQYMKQWPQYEKRIYNVDEWSFTLREDGAQALQDGERNQCE